MMDPNPGAIAPPGPCPTPPIPRIPLPAGLIGLRAYHRAKDSIGLPGPPSVVNRPARTHEE